MACFPEGQDVTDVIELSGKWQFYFGKHLTRSQMRSIPMKDRCYISVPSNWQDLKINGKELPAFGIATYFLSIGVDTNLVKSPRDYAFRVGNITSAYKMYVNNTLVMWVGNAGTVKNQSMPGYYPHIGYFHSRKDTLDVILHVSNFFYPFYSGVSRPILFGQEEQINREHLLTTALSILLICIFGVLFLFELVVFFVYPKEKMHLMVSLLAFLFLIKMLMDSDMTIFHFLPNVNYYIGFRLWLLCMLTIPIMFSLFKSSYSTEMFRSIVVVHSIYSVYALAVLTVPFPILLEYILPPFIYFSMVCLLYLLWVATRVMFKRRRYSTIHWFSFLFAFGSMLYDLHSIADPNKVHFLTQLGICIYLMVQAIIILFRFIRAHKLSLKLTYELEVANQNLEVTVASRTKDLQLTNSKLEKINHQKNFMLATTTHDLKNSFNILINCSRYLADDKTLNNEQRIYANMVQEATKNGYRVLENILSWAKMQMTDYNGSNEIRNIKSLIVKEIESFRNQLNEKSLHINIDLNNDFVFCCEEDQFFSISQNLLSNAIKFSQPGGEIFISNKLVDGLVEIHIKDHGVGMDTPMLQTLFDNTIDNKRRGTSGESGSGLGLIIVKELVESNKGTISCISELGKGSDFILRFPHCIK
ncbi:MAG TPA: sensor histidine kinase [Bacteroidales bacterium]|nr:sensor histidine kinase [Bacteroidales bacterium]